MAGLLDLLRAAYGTQQPDPNDLSSDYNTKLSPADEAAFQAWAKANHRTGDSYDYDMRGAWKHMVKQSANGHFPDTYKKPNHPTFSNESQYAVGPALQGGQWGDNSFTPGATNLRFRSLAELQQYMGQAEPDSRLVPPSWLRGK